VKVFIPLVGLVLAMSTSGGVAQGFPVFNFLATPRGPDGTQRAHVGDTITTSIRFQNTDDFDDSLMVTNLVNIIGHNSGIITTSNLLPGPVLLPNFGDFVWVTNTFTVLPGDGPNLSCRGEFGAHHNADGPGTTHLNYDFAFGSTASIRVFAPAIRVAQSCAIICTQGTPVLMYSGTISNRGSFNTTLTNVSVISDNGTPGNANDDTVLFMGTLTNGQAATFSNVYALPSQTTTNSVRVCGTDELALTVWDTNQCVIPLGSPVPMDAPTVGRPGYLRLKWASEIGTAYQVQSKAQLEECFWNNRPFIVSATATNTIVEVPLNGSAQFFRVVDVD
jgi:hypothetical protein